MPPFLREAAAGVCKASRWSKACVRPDTAYLTPEYCPEVKYSAFGHADALPQLLPMAQDIKIENPAVLKKKGLVLLPDIP